MPSQRSRHTNPETLASINGRIVASSRASISIHDWAVRYGWGAFETIRVSHHRPLFLDRHLSRISTCARILLLDRWDEISWWRREVERVVKRFGQPEAAINLLWTRGEAPAFAGQRIVIIRTVQDHARRNGRIWVAPWRMEPTAPGVGRKTLAFLPNMFAMVAAKAAGCDDAILLNTRGRVVDGAQASVFAIEDGCLLTPALREGALAGITRGLLLEIAQSTGIPVKQLALPLARLEKADGVFLTSVLRGLSVVREIGGVPVGLKPEAHRVVDGLRRAYRKRLTSEIAANQ